MTIDSAWVKILKENDPSAFTDQCPLQPDVVFIDAQIKLPKAESVTTWQELVHRNFVWPVRRWFATGAKHVVLAFDDYAHVPTSKGMTQCKRRRHIPPKVIHAHESLPPTIPPDYMELIMNRVFKTKVIDLVVEFLPRLLDLAPHQTLIVDWNTNALIFRSGCTEPEQDPSLPPLGECDCKATRYTRFGNLLIDTTDGDYIPISLMHLEKQMRDTPDAPAPGNIVIYRMQCRVGGALPAASRGKRKQKQDTDTETTKTHQRISYEFVHINRLFRSVHRAISRSLSLRTDTQYSFFQQGRPGSSSSREHMHGVLDRARGHEMRLFTFLIAFTGTDFSKGLPYLSPKKLWDHLKQGLWERIVLCYNRDEVSLDTQRAVDVVISHLYQHAYKNHVSAAKAMRMADVAEQLKVRSKLSETVRNRLPGEGNALCLVRNANWLLQYWQCREDGSFPDPITGGAYGYKLDRKGKPMYEDD